MFWGTLLLLFFLLKSLSLQFLPVGYDCEKFHYGNFWWSINYWSTKDCCEILSEEQEECGECMYITWGKRNMCAHVAYLWKWSFYHIDKVQYCKMKDHCMYTYQMDRFIKYKIKNRYGKIITNFTYYICGEENENDEHVVRGDCKSVYGTYICDCQEPFKGRDCNDLGPDGAFATGVQVVMNVKVRVSEMFTVLIALKEQGNELKVHVKATDISVSTAVPTLTLLEPVIVDSSSRQLIEYCKTNVGLKTQCETYLEGSTYLYSIKIRFPFMRKHAKIGHYHEKVNNNTIIYLDGYTTQLIVTTTNIINGVEKESFYRNIFDRAYTLFVIYPTDTGCYTNIRITNCEELQQTVDVYHADKEIEVYGEMFDVNQVVEVANLPCLDKGDNTIIWKVSQFIKNGTFVTNIFESKAKSEFKLVIKPYSFQTGIYVVELSYALLTSKGETESFDQCFFTVVEAPLIAFIEGGRSRYIYVDIVVTLDGSKSKDPNLQGNSSKDGVSFEWSCIAHKNNQPCLGDYLSPKLGSRYFIKLPPSVLEAHENYTITLKVTKKGKTPAYYSQTLHTDDKGYYLSISLTCENCMEGNIANPTDFIKLLVKVVVNPKEITKHPLNYTWTFSTYPVYPPNSATDSIRVNLPEQNLLLIGKNKLISNNTYCFRVAIAENKLVFSEIDIHIPPIKNFTCSLTPDSGIVAVTNFSLNCSIMFGFTFEVYDKSYSDPNYYSGRMLFTNELTSQSFKLASEKIVVYGYNNYKMIEEWVQEVKLTPFDGQLKDITDMVDKLKFITNKSNQTRLHSASIIPGALNPKMDWSSTNILKRLISFIYQIEFNSMSEIKLVLSSIQFILVVMFKNKPKEKYKLELEEAEMCANIISALANSLFERVKHFDGQTTLTEIILHQMIESHLNVIEIVFLVRHSKVFSIPFYLVNPYFLNSVKEITYNLVGALYKLSSCLLWRQIQGDSATEIVSNGFKIRQWVIVNPPEVLYYLREQNKSTPFNFSVGFYHILKKLDVLGIQVTNLKVNPFWWAGGDINTNILLIDICFKVEPTECKYQRTFYKAPIFLYFDISQTYSLIKPLEIHTVYLNLSNDIRDLDFDITVYRFDPPLRAKIFIQFEFENSTEDYRVLFCKNERPDFEMMQDKGITINNGNQSTVQYLNYVRDDSDKLYYMGIFPLLKGIAGERVKFKLKIVYAVCKTWLKWNWGSQRCWVGEQETDERTLRCDCNHLSMFAGAVQVPSYTLNPAIEFLLFLTEEFNWLPLLVFIVIIVVFIILFLWGWRKDRKDSIKGVVTVLQDNYPGESFAYLLGVYTGSRINSSTDANVGLRLFGQNDRSRAHILKNSNRPTLRGNTDDWFLLYCPTHLGTLESLHIWHDNSGKSPDWFVEKIEVYDLTDKVEYIFELNIWLALGVNEYPDAVVATSNVYDFYSFKRVFLSNVVTAFRDTNYWTSIFWKNARNPVKRVHRIGTVLCYIMVAMICSVIVYHFNKGEEYEEDEPSYAFNSTDLYVFFISLLLALFTAYLIMFLFRKSFSHKYVRMQSSLFIRPAEVPSERNVEFNSLQQNTSISQTDMSKNLARLSQFSLYESTKPRFIQISSKHLDEKSISLGLRGKLPNQRSTYENFAVAIHAIVRGSTLEPVRLPKYRRNVILHKKYYIGAWTLFIVVIISAFVIVVIFGHRIPTVESNKWFTVFLCVLLFDALILSTLKILACSFILGYVFQRLVPASNYQIKPEDGMQKKLVGDTNLLTTLAQIRSHPMYCPLNEKSKELYRLKCVRREQWKTLVDFCVVLLLILVLVMLTSLFTVSLYSSNAHAAWMLTKGPSLNYKNYTNIYNKTLFQEFLLHNFIHQLHRYLWYNQKHPINYYKRRKSWAYDCTTRLLGNARMRQLRVVLGECPDIKYFQEMEEYCSPPWSFAVEDTGTYGVRWYIGGNEDIRRKTTAWRYTDSEHSNSSESYGKTLIIYPSGGYIENLGFEKDETEGALASLFPQRWLDHTTRAVFVELTLYNVNTRLFTQVILVAEHMPTGEYLVDVKADSVTTDFTFDVWKFSFSVFLIFFLVRMCILINRSGIFVYFSKVINVFEGFLLALGFLTLCFYLSHITSSSYYVQEFHRSGTNAFFNFSNLISYIFWSRSALCILFVCTVMRALTSFRFGRIYLTFYYTFVLSLPWIVWLVLFLLLYLAVIQRFVGYLLNIAVFSYYTFAIIYRMDPLVNSSEYYSHKVFVYLMCLLSFVVISMFIASFVYYYKVGKAYRLIDTNNFNFYIFLKRVIIRKHLNK